MTCGKVHKATDGVKDLNNLLIKYRYVYIEYWSIG